MSQVATTNGATQDKTQKQDKPQGEKGGKREGNTFKGNRTDKAEEHKGEREPREPFKYKPRHRGLAGEKITVTLETVIPDLPKKNETIAQPSDEAFQAELDKIQKDIDDCYKKISDLNKDARKGSSFPTDKAFTDFVDLLKVKQEEKRRAYTEFQGTTAERDLYKKQVEDYHDRANELRFKMKVPGKRSDLETQLKHLNGLQTKGNITIQQEKNLIKEISEIQRSLPFAGPLEELEIQAKEINDLLKVSKQKTGEKFAVYKLLREECQDIEDKITKLRDEHEEKKKKEDNTPAIEKMKEDYRAKITTLKQKKKDTYEGHKESWRKYEEQQTEIERIKLMRRKKEKLVREEQRRIRDEEWKKQKALEEEENKEIPYRGQIELCELLIKYCNRLTPSTEDANTAADQKDKQLVIEEALKTEEWKQAKGQYLTSKREKEDDFFSGAKKTKKKVVAKPQETQPTVLPLNHQIETLNFFEEIKVAPPLFVDKLPETLKILQEKKAYFEKLSQEATQADEARSNMTEEEKKKYDEEEKQKKAEEQQQQQQEKKENRRAAKKKFDVESEQDFPKM